VGEAIFLEDDCLPDPTFFRYCGELLEYYKNDKRVMFISGNNFQFNRRRSQGSYYFSEFSHVWGWATWKRVWDKYDFNMKSWPKVKENDSFRYWLNSPQAVKYWANIFDKVYDKKIDTWDIQLEFACWSNNGLSIAPEVNLVSNIGFGFDASHTVDSKNKSANIPTTAIEFPLKHPSIIIRDQDADRFEEKTHYLYTITDRIINKIKKIFNL
jgi:hypothetical protein